MTNSIQAARQLIITYQFPLVVVLATKVLLLFWIADFSFVNRWMIRDAAHYVSIAEFGYNQIGREFLICFYPMFPLLVYLVGKILLGHFLLSGYLVTAIGSFVTACLLYKLTSCDYSIGVARRAVLALFLFPSALFLHIPYTESVTLSFVLGSFLLMRRRMYWWAFLFGAFALATRSQALALVPAVVVEIMLYSKLPKLHRLLYSLAGVMIVLLGFVFFLAINKYYFDDFFAYVSFWRSAFGTSFDLFRASGLRHALDMLRLDGLHGIVFGYYQLWVFALALLALVYSIYRKMRLSYIAYFCVALVISYSPNVWLSMPRFALSFFPMFIAIAMLTGNRWVAIISFGISAILMCIISAIALGDYWIV